MVLCSALLTISHWRSSHQSQPVIIRSPFPPFPPFPLSHQPLSSPPPAIPQPVPSPAYPFLPPHPFILSLQIPQPPPYGSISPSPPSTADHQSDSQLHPIMPPPPPPTIASGVAYDGYLSGCRIFLDLDGDGTEQPLTEPHTTTDFAGRWSLDLSSVGKNSMMMNATLRIVPGDAKCYDVTFQTQLRLPLASSSGSSVIGPLTTLTVSFSSGLEHAPLLPEYET